MKGHHKVAFLLYKKYNKVRLNLIAFFIQKKLKNKMAGVLGFEPRDAEIKTRCLTAWRYPNRNSLIENKEDFI